MQIGDELMFSHAMKLSEYDFASEVDVNILGHIFENSLNELDEIKAQLEGVAIDKSKTKRKKEGVFYTPKYITKYIVENTVGRLCREKREALGIVDEEYTNEIRRQAKTRQGLVDRLTDYRNWLLQLTICDPACGSGAFLNQALDFLIAEHRSVDELQARLFGDAMVLSDLDKSILENNLYGVDLNEESVEIARLSLWLRTARPNRTLNDLSNNIKVGNSLIDDPAVAGDKAFNWHKEFPQVFAKGGFDVVIGNPPYSLCQPSNTSNLYLEKYKIFQVSSYKIDLFHLFFERSILLLSEKGKLGFITPNTYLTNKYIIKLREFILNTTFIEIIINHTNTVFEDADVDVATIVLTKKRQKNDNILIYKDFSGDVILTTSKNQIIWFEDGDKVFNLRDSPQMTFSDCDNLGNICSTYFGIQAFDRNSSVHENAATSFCKPLIDGVDVKRYEYAFPNKYFDYQAVNIKSGGDWNVYIQDRIVIRQIGISPVVGLCHSGILTSNTIYNLFITNDHYSLKFILSLLNSELIQRFWLSKFSDNKDLFPKIKGYQLKNIPIKITPPIEQLPFILKADQMLTLNKQLQELSGQFHRTLGRHFGLVEISTKLKSWYQLSYGSFIRELQKKKVKLTLAQEAEWEGYFKAEAAKAQELRRTIDTTDREIDRMVYALYGLTEEEIGVVEGKDSSK